MKEQPRPQSGRLNIFYVLLALWIGILAHDYMLYRKNVESIPYSQFLNYVDSNRYVITDPVTGQPAPVFFHRSVPGFIIQSGGFLATASPDDHDVLRPTGVATSVSRPV